MMPQDPFTPPEELVNVMKGLKNLFEAGILAGMPEHIAKDFIVGVYVTFSQLNAQAAAPPPEK